MEDPNQGPIYPEGFMAKNGHIISSRKCQGIDSTGVILGHLKYSYV